MHHAQDEVIGCVAIEQRVPHLTGYIARSGRCVTAPCELGGSIGIPVVFSVGSAEASIGLASRLRSSDVKGERAPSSADRSPRDNLACMNCVGGD